MSYVRARHVAHRDGLVGVTAAARMRVGLARTHGCAVRRAGWRGCFVGDGRCEFVDARAIPVRAGAWRHARRMQAGGLGEGAVHDLLGDVAAVCLELGHKRDGLGPVAEAAEHLEDALDVQLLGVLLGVAALAFPCVPG